MWNITDSVSLAVQAAPAGLIEAERVEEMLWIMKMMICTTIASARYGVWPRRQGSWEKTRMIRAAAEISRVDEHEGIAARFQHGRIVVADTADDVGDDEADDHEDGDGRDDVDARRRELRRIDIGKDETGDDQEKHELR